MVFQLVDRLLKIVADIDVTFGLLYYLELTKTLSIRGVRHELLQMIQVRNHLAGYIRERQQLPPMLRKARQCIRCYARTPDRKSVV